ncbi:MAG TPA: hypothetical protein VEQ61_03360 [Thermoleophilaceae bacterium]|nr:hypothetical protein [Thermoleophilaceae bacterium]
MNIAAYFLFLLAGLGFGYGAVMPWKLVPLLLPIALAAGAVWRNGADGDIFVRLVIALIVTAIGIAVGWALDERGAARRGRSVAA